MTSLHMTYTDIKMSKFQSIGQQLFLNMELSKKKNIFTSIKLQQCVNLCLITTLTFY